MREQGGTVAGGGSLSVRASLPMSALLALLSALLAGASGFVFAASIVAFLELVAGYHAAVVVLIVVPILPVLLATLAGLLLFGFCALFFGARAALFWRPAVEVDARGITDRSSALGAGFVPWDAVGGVRLLGGAAGESFVGIAVRDEDAFLSGHHPLKRSLIRLNRRRFTGTTIVIPLRGLLTTEEELLAAMVPHLRSPARGRAGRLLAGLRAREAQGASGRSGPPSAPWRRASRAARRRARGAVLLALSTSYFASCSTLLFTGVLVVLMAFGVLESYPFDGATLAVGVVLLLLAVVDFVYFPRLVERITGRKPL